MLTAAVEKRVRGALNRRGKKPLPPVSVRDTLDLQTPGCLLVLACAKLCCHFEGCCYGIPYARGIYSAYLKTNVFPEQIAETVSILLVFAALMVFRKRKTFRRGMAYPFAAALYCAVRFFWEFYRYYPEQMRRLVLGMTLWQAVSLAVCIVSVVLLVVLYKKEPAARTKQILHHKKKRS